MKKEGNAVTIRDSFMSHIGATMEEIKEWFLKFKRNLFRIDRLSQAIGLVKEAIINDRPIRIIGDHDVDGVSATTILANGLEEAGAKDVGYYITHKFSEGYGANACCVKEQPEGCLLILVDNGVSAHAAVEQAKAMGMTVVILDHHQPEDPECLPEADVLIDPAAFPETADFSGYCGAGLAFRLIRELLGDASAVKYLPLAAIATVADVVPLRGENYVLVRTGLNWIRNGQAGLPGLAALLEAIGVGPHLDEVDVGFQVAPVINAPCRIYDAGADKAVKCLRSKDRMEALTIARSMVLDNEERKRLVKVAMEKAAAVIAEEGLSFDPILLVRIPDICEGICGIIAGRLAEAMSRPAIVMTNSVMERRQLKGSGRSYGTIDLTATLRSSGADFTTLGGHPAACGLSMMEWQEAENREKILRAFVDVTSEEESEPVYDLEITPGDAHEALLEAKRYAPYGEGNPPIRFKVRMRPEMAYGTVVRRMNAGGVKIQEGRLSAVGFGISDVFPDLKAGQPIDLIGTLGVNRYNGRETDQLMITDYAPVSA